MIQEIKQRILNGGSISKDEAITLLNFEDKEQLYALADDIRCEFKGDFLEMCSIMNAKSGKCTQNCSWCSQSMFHNTNVEEYELVDLKEAEELAEENAQKGVYRFSLVTSGRAISNKNLDQLCGVYKNIKQKTPIHLCASMGLLNRSQLDKLYASGVRHYHCNIETAPSYFKEVCTSHTIEDKIRTIKQAREAGMGVCSGGIIGMGESMEQRIEMALTLRELEIESIPINVLMPVEGTRLANVEPLTDEEVLSTFALFRLINPTAHIRLAGGRNLINHIQDKALKAGVSAALVGDYLTTIGTNINQDKDAFSSAGFRLDHELCVNRESALK
ncbi:biotin synthase BioB [Carboxylicivirga sp. M1479]|uniref:biotin synthase BioB n=1 Tax=Carboxylicivirga sp. M1479 TaxID=2594476 RepID=UPI001177D545|nr:biotin synthase BioB [Carboxylicivirga sp. M1479]TRX64269.1 biotin synthase BioB [Carboxylicivirga sp. M1479]